MNQLYQNDSLSKKVFHGGLWVFALRIINRGLGFIRTIILARLLSPEDFGLLGIAMLAISTLETFSQTGFQLALVQKKDDIKAYLDTAWTVSVIRGIILFFILFVSAPIVAEFFNSPQASLVIRVIGLSTLFSGFRNIAILYFQKELEFNKQFYYEFTATFVDLCVALILACLLRNVWALVWGGLASNLVRLFLSYALHPYRPRIQFRKKKFQELFAFGKWAVGSGILVFLITNGDDIFVGKMLGTIALGYYQMAYLLSNLPATEIAQVVSMVTFPAYSKLQNDLSKLKDAYLKVLQLTALVSIPFAGLIFVFAADFTKIFLGQKWMPINPIMYVLVFAGSLRAFAVTSGLLFYAVGKPKIDTKLQLVRLAVLSFLIYPATIKFGIIGLSAAVLLSVFISNIGFSLMTIKMINCRLSEFGERLLFPVVNTTIAALIILGLKNRVGNGLESNLVLAILMLILYAILTYICDKLFHLRVQEFLRDLLHPLLHFRIKSTQN